MVKFKLFNIETVDCTADPHIVAIDSISKLLEIALKTCESDLVKAINCVKLYIEYKSEKMAEYKIEQKFDSDYYSIYSFKYLFFYYLISDNNGF